MPFETAYGTTGEDPQTRLVSVPNPANDGRTERDRAGASHRAMGALRRGRFDVLGRSPFRTTLYVHADALACHLADYAARTKAQRAKLVALCDSMVRKDYAANGVFRPPTKKETLQLTMDGACEGSLGAAGLLRVCNDCERRADWCSRCWWCLCWWCRRWRRHR